VAEPDVIVIGAGAAGIATAIFTRRLAPGLTVHVLDGARKPGAKILVSGGARCNVTNACVTEQDFWGGKRTMIRRVLHALSVTETVAFFDDIGVSLHEEEHGKLFPDTNRARDVLEALMRELDCPGERFEQIDGRLAALASARPKSSLATALSSIVSASAALVLLDRLQIAAAGPLAHFSRTDRRRLAHALAEWPLDVADSRGYNYAEVTAGGVALDEIDPATMASRKCPGLFLVGEILDVDGRIGGFNFQWAWSSARSAARGLARDGKW